MRIFIDCTHTAKNRYKNTGIHRVVRELTTELTELNQNYQKIEIIPVMFDGRFIQRVDFLQQPSQISSRNSGLLQLLINNQVRTFLLRLKNKFVSYFSVILFYFYWNYQKYKQPGFLEFDSKTILPGDIYVIADANWDLPKTYYNFLEILKHYGVNITIICYDLIPIKFPVFCSRKFATHFTSFYKSYSNLFDHVLCISRNSAEDYRDAQRQGILASNNPNLKIEVFRLGCNYSNHDEPKDSNQVNQFQHLLKTRYILVVGSILPHKNIKTIIEAFDLLINSKQEEIHLVFAGNKGWNTEVDNLIESHKMYDKLIHILGSVTDFELNILYKNCYCLVQASFYEGFGLPVVEALQNGKPVIASNTGSLPEVGGRFCIYFNPHDHVELYRELEKLMNSDSYYNQLVTRIREEYQIFTWRESAEEFLSHLLT
ncbi:hypothetical protein CV014_09585 [Nostoc sp. CMAA1605]|nr:hypothetical protein [Nostoc sp. CMAA1605]